MTAYLPMHASLGLLALATAASLPAYAASPGATFPAVEQSGPVSSATMTALYLAAHPELRTDPAFARDWTAVTKCADWRRLYNDEFRAAPFLKAGAVELATGREPAPQSYEVHFDRNLGRYDAGTQQFALPTVGATDVLPVRIQGFFGEKDTSQFTAGCAPTGGKYPVEFTVAFANPEVANGLPMAASAAEAFARSRTDQYGSRENRVGVTLKLSMTLGTPHPVDPAYVAKGVVVPVSARIEDVTVDDGTPRHGVIYRLDEAKRKAGDDAAAEARRQARADAAAVVKPLDAATLTAQFEAERAGAKVGTEPTAIGVPTFWTQGDAPGDETRRFRLKPSDRFTVGGTPVGLRFENAAEVAALIPTPDLVAFFTHNTNWGASVTYVPVGATDDPQKGGPTVVGHVLSVDTVDGSTSRRRILSIRTPSTAVPWTATVDNRTAASFDVLGIKVGMGVDEVTSLAEAALGQKLAFDATRGNLRSPLEECDFDRMPGRPAPPLGRRCLTASFARPNASGRWTLVRLRLKQTAAATQGEAVRKALEAKYGFSELTRQFTPPASLADMEGLERHLAAVGGWGVRLSDRRPEPDGIPIPLHPFEVIAQIDGDQLTTTLTLTDGAVITSAVEAEAAAKRAADGVATKF